MAVVLAACTSPPIQHRDGSTSARTFSVTDLAKSDIDTITEINQQEAIGALKRLTEKLYRRNPAEWRKGNCGGPEQATRDVFAPLDHWDLASRKTLDWKASIFTAFRDDYAGDRVRSLMEGLLTMTMASYDNKVDLYLFDSLDPQKLYNTARNFEVVAWKLSNARNSKGEFILLTNGTDGNGVSNFTFEREFGKLIATQDLIARIIEDKTNRSIRTGVIDTATFFLFPI
jgi:hypothetical protein